MCQASTAFRQALSVAGEQTDAGQGDQQRPDRGSEAAGQYPHEGDRAERHQDSGRRDDDVPGGGVAGSERAEITAVVVEQAEVRLQGAEHDPGHRQENRCDDTTCRQHLRDHVPTSAWLDMQRSYVRTSP
jgi:hypothetical protein